MKTTGEIKTILPQNKIDLNKKFNIKKLWIFCSYSRGEQLENSDIDKLVEFSKPIGLDFVELVEELEKILDIKVDLVSKGAIKPKMWKYIEEDLIYV